MTVSAAFIRRISLCLLAGTMLTAGAGNAWAQVPPSADPGIIGRSLESDDRSRPPLEGNIVLPQMDEPAIEGSTEKVFTLRDVVIEGSTVYDANEAKAIAGDFIGQEVSFADLNRITNNLTRRYREDGYIFSRAVLPPQDIENGVVRIRAIEGRVANVEVTGDYKDRGGLIRSMASKIQTDGPTNTNDIERYLLLIDDLPGITARSFVRPSATQGAGDLVIVVEQDGFEGSATIDNRGSRYVGPWRGELVGAFNSLFGIHDRTTLRTIIASQSEELQYGEITHEQQLFTEGLRLRGRYAITSTKPGGDLSPLGVEGDSELFDVEALFPVIRSRELNLGLNAGFNANNTQTELSGIEIGRDRIRSARITGTFDFSDRFYGINQFDLGATKGLDVMSATNDGLGRSRANGEHEFTRFNATATRVQDLFLPGVSAMVSASGQYTEDPLLASEEFTVGGPGFGRAYDSGEIAGDKGYSGLLELRYSGPVPAGSFVQNYQLYSFIDYGKVMNISPVVGETEEDSLTSAGIGVRYNLEHALSGYVEIDRPINKEVNAEGDDDTRVFMTLTKRF